MDERPANEGVRRPPDGVIPPDNEAIRGQGAFQESPPDANVNANAGSILERAGDAGSVNEAKGREEEEKIQSAGRERLDAFDKGVGEVYDSLDAMLKEQDAQLAARYKDRASFLVQYAQGYANQVTDVYIKFAMYILKKLPWKGVDAAQALIESKKLVSDALYYLGKYCAILEYIALLMTGNVGGAVINATIDFVMPLIRQLPMGTAIAAGIQAITRMLGVGGYDYNQVLSMMFTIFNPLKMMGLASMGVLKTVVGQFGGQAQVSSANELAKQALDAAGGGMDRVSEVFASNAVVKNLLIPVMEVLAGGSWLTGTIMTAAIAGGAALSVNTLFWALSYAYRKPANMSIDHAKADFRAQLSAELDGRVQHLNAAGMDAGADPIVSSLKGTLKGVAEEDLTSKTFLENALSGVYRPEQVADFLTRGHYDPNKAHVKSTYPFMNEGDKALSEAMKIFAVSHGMKKPLNINDFVNLSGRMVNPSVAYQGANTLKRSGSNSVRMGATNPRDTLISAIKFSHAVHTIQAFVNRDTPLSPSEIFQILVIMENEHVPRRTFLAALESFTETEGMGSSAYSILTDLAILTAFAFHDVKIVYDKYGACRQFVEEFVEKNVEQEDPPYVIYPVVEGCQRIVDLLKAGTHSLHAHQLVQHNKVKWWNNPTYELESTPIE